MFWSGEREWMVDGRGVARMGKERMISELVYNDFLTEIFYYIILLLI